MVVLLELGNGIRIVRFLVLWVFKEWLERPDREAEKRATTLLENMVIKATAIIADIGAGSGYYGFKMADLTNEGLIYRVDIQEKNEVFGITNVELIKASEYSINGRCISRIFLSF